MILTRWTPFQELEAFERRTRRHCAATGDDNLLFQIFNPFGYVAAARSAAINVTLSQKDK